MLVSIDSFGGALPRDEPHLIPDSAATLARNCDVRTRGVTSLKDLGSAAVTIPFAVKSLFTLDGLQFFTWNENVHAAKAPTISDTYNRVYYADSTGPRVTQSPFATTSGGTPSTNWRLGVPVPDLTSGTVANLTSLPDGMSLNFRFFFESNGVKYQEQAMTVTQVTLGREYVFTVPTRDVSASNAGSNVVITDYFNGTGWHTVGTVASPQQAVVIGTASIQLVPEGTIFNGVSYISTDAQATFSSVATLWTAISALDKTPITAVPTIQLDGVVAANTAFTAYSDGSTFVRSDQPVKLSLKEDTPTTLRVLIEWGGDALNGTSTSAETAAWVLTLVNVFGEESGPSLPKVLTKDYLQGVTLTATIPANAGQYQGITKIRAYKSISNTGDAYFLVAEQAVVLSAGQVYPYVVPVNSVAAIGSTLESTTRVPPPTDCKGALVAPFGSIILWRANELWPSEMYRGHAFSSDYVVTFPNDIITCRITAFGIMVWTTAGVYIVNGSNPRSLLPQRIPIRQTVVNPQAIAVYENTVVFASPDGLVMVRGSDATLDPFLQIMTRAQWRTKYSARFSTLCMAAHDGYVIGMFASGDGFMIRLDETAGSYVEHSINGTGAFYFPQTDELYIGLPSGIAKWATGNDMTWQWNSKLLRTGKPLNMGVFEGRGSGTINVTVIGDGLTVAAFTLTLADTGSRYRMPTTGKYQHYRINIVGAPGALMTGARICGVPAELGGV